MQRLTLLVAAVALRAIAQENRHDTNLHFVGPDAGDERVTYRKTTVINFNDISIESDCNLGPRRKYAPDAGPK